MTIDTSINMFKVLHNNVSWRQYLKCDFCGGEMSFFNEWIGNEHLISIECFKKKCYKTIVSDKKLICEMKPIDSTTLLANVVKYYFDKEEYTPEEWKSVLAMKAFL